MEILSIGEKIKRARICKGYTLKELCYGKISISKMSCIENDKTTIASEVLEFIAEKLDKDINYFKEDIEEQISKNINTCHDTFGNLNYEKDMLYNLKIAEQYGYFNSAFNIVHCLFSYYIKLKANEKLQNILEKYYEIYFKANSEENQLIYNMDMGRFLFVKKEYQQAINYYKAARCNSTNFDVYKEESIEIILEEVRCNIILRKYKDAEDIIKLLLEHENNIESNNKLSEIYHLVAILYLRNNTKDFSIMKNKASDINKEDYYMKAKNKFDYAVIFFEEGYKNEAIKFLEKATEIYPKEDKLKLAGFILENIRLLIQNKEIEIADSLLKNSLDLAINSKKDEFIERAYYYKFLILCVQGNFISAEMYINLSLDILTKIGVKCEIYLRYMEIGNMYNKIGITSDSLKYFSLAIALMKKI